MLHTDGLHGKTFETMLKSCCLSENVLTQNENEIIRSYLFAVMHFETNKAINLIMKSNEAEGNKVSTC